jgi:hypothetical protein
MRHRYHNLEYTLNIQDTKFAFGLIILVGVFVKKKNDAIMVVKHIGKKQKEDLCTKLINIFSNFFFSPSPL